MESIRSALMYLSDDEKQIQLRRTTISHFISSIQIRVDLGFSSWLTKPYVR